MSGKKILKFEKEEVVEDKQYQQVFNFARLKENLDITVVRNTPELLEMELQGIDASFANGLRRIIIAEISTMAFHKVMLFQNTSVIPDELLVHRLGLLPVQVDPNEFENRPENGELSAENSLKFELKVICRRKKEF
jgi:DNA-directed RNA polymerase I and III subunit RPAC1